MLRPNSITFRLACRTWCREYSAVMATELLQPRDLACGTLLPVQLRNSDIIYGLFRQQLKGHLLREARTQRSVTSDMRRHGKTLTYLLTYLDLLWICCRRRTKRVLLYVCCVLYITLSTTIVVESVRCTTNRGNGVWAYSCKKR